MFELTILEQQKPFCPIHHWRMAFDTGSSKTGASYRCSFHACTMRFASAQGYFEAGLPAHDQDLLSRLENITCQKNRAHHPCIVGYAKESNAGHTEEWRQWECFTEDCGFYHRQKLSKFQSAETYSEDFVPVPAPSDQHEYVLAKR